jgi:selenocysteine-specific elongation factor
MHFIIGTAGHVDHGKTTLIRALTGIETDRLREERERGLSIVPGFAHLQLPPVNGETAGRTVGIVDVPGHERFLKNMLSGIAGVDVAMLVIAADEGVMPQTLEHLHILELLQIKRGIIVLTKCDLVDAEWLQLSRDDVRTRLTDAHSGGAQSTLWRRAPMIEVSAAREQGLNELKATLAALCHQLEAQNTSSGARPFRLAIDRSFSISGFGTVVTGSASQGVLSVGESVDVWTPGALHAVKARVRTLEVHGAETQRIETGQRSAINLAGIGVEQAARGGTIAAVDSLQAARTVDVWFQLLPDAPRALKRESTLRLHIGTAEVGVRSVLYELPRLERGGEAFARLHLDEPLVAVRGDRFVLREVANERVLGGGHILALDLTSPRREVLPWLHEWHDALSRDEFALATSLLRYAGAAGIHQDQLARELKLSGIETLLQTPEAQKNVWPVPPYLLHATVAKQLQQQITEALKTFHQDEPLQPAMPRERLRAALPPSLRDEVWEALLTALSTRQKIVIEASGVRLKSHRVELSEAEARVRQQLVEMVGQAAFQPLTLDEIVATFPLRDEALVRRLNTLFLKSGEWLRVGDWVLPQSTLEAGAQLLREHFGRENTLSVSQAREILHTTRKWAVPLLEWYDKQGVTRRQGELRVLR